LSVLAAALVAGVGVAEIRSVVPVAALAVLSAAALCALLTARRRALAALVLVFALGLLRGAVGWESADRGRAALDPAEISRPGWHAGVIRGPVLESARGYRAVLDSGGRRLLLTAVGPGPRPLPGDRVRAWGRLGTEPRYLAGGGAIERERRRVSAAGAVARLVTGADHVEIHGAERSVWRGVARLQRRIAAAIAGRDPGGDGAAVVAALVSGDRSAIGDELSAALRRAGVGHLLAVSGLHIGALAWLVFSVTRRLWAMLGRAASAIDPEVAASLASLAAAGAYAAITGGRPSALRALLVVAVLLLGRARARRARVIDALGAAAIALLLHRPALLFDPSFQMSFGAAAVLSIAFGGRPPRRTWGGRCASLVIASAWATAATAPVAAAMFGEIAPVAALTNVVAIPAVALFVLPVALAGTAIAAIAPGIGGALLDLAIAAADVLCAGSRAVAAVAPSFPLPALSGLEMIAWAAALGALLWATRRRHLGAALLGVALAAATLASALWPPPPGGLRVTFIDVGQGDAALVETPGGAAILIDTGGLPGGRRLDRRSIEVPGARAVLPLLRERRIRALDVVALSHPHPDHHGGLGALIGAVEIREVWAVPGPGAVPDLDAVLRALAVTGTEVRAPPESIDIGGVRVEVLAPRYLGRIAADPVSSVNDNSMVLAIEYAGRRILFTGDIEVDGEELLLADRRGRLRADLVKVAHHGSSTSSTESFVAATGAAHAIISCGRGNRFGFPDGGVVDRWRAAGARIIRTDVVGSITASIDRGGAISVETAAPIE
jgi:competence protein ComEC